MPSPRLLRALPFGLALASVLLMSACLPWNSAKFKSDKEVRVAFRAQAPLQVTSRNGSIQARTSTKVQDVQIDAVVKATTQERADATQVTAEYNQGGTLVVAVVWPGGAPEDGEGCSFKIALPKGAGALNLLSSNGALSATGWNAPARLTTSNGKITVREHDGSVRAHSSNGAVTIRGRLAEVDAVSSNGALLIEGAMAKVSAKTSNGAIEVQCADSGTGPVALATSNGRVTLGIGAGFAGSLDIETSNGSISLDPTLGVANSQLDKGRARLDSGISGPESRLRTSNGRVKVERVKGR